MILDACVLIDFIQADATVLSRLADHIGPLHVSSTVVAEVNAIEEENDLTELGLIPIEPTLEDAFAAASHTGATSFQDRLCLLAAKRHGLICVTNDKNLRKLCRGEGVHTLWGLELLANLHQAEGISAKEAESIAVAIQKSNPRHITDKIVTRLMEIIRRKGTR
jgi:rRNA-processing protein FCF1